jgi:hypothetical protein
MIRKNLLIFMVFLMTGSIYAGVTGKIAGIVVDSKNGEPLPGVNIILEGTLMGASSDAEGFYAILNLPPGIYTVQASYIGYNNVEVIEVKVSVDLTTTINIELAETTLELSETITVISQRPLIKNDEVSTRHYVSSEEIEVQPIDNFKEIARNQAGVVGNNFRGGRSGEVLVLIDGIPVKDPAGTYSGNLGNFTGDVPKFGIQEMEVSLGGFSAEYGNVQSGIMNLALQEGTTNYTGRLRFTSNNFGTTAINTNVATNSYHYLGAQDTLGWQKENSLMNYIYEFNLNGPEPITQILLPMIGVKLPGKIGFSFSGQINDLRHGYYNNQESFDQTFQAKLTYRMTPHHKLMLGSVFNNREYDRFYFPASKYGTVRDYPINDFKFLSGNTLTHIRYVDDPTKYPLMDDGSRGFITTESDSFGGAPYDQIRNVYSAGMQDYLWYRKQNTTNIYAVWTHTLNSRTFYEVRLNHMYTNFHYAGRDVDDRDNDGDREEDLQWNPDLGGPNPIDRERQDNYWWVMGDDPGYRDQKSYTYGIKTDLVSQINKNHLLKAGIELYHHNIQVENISWTLGYGIFRKDIWDENTIDFGVYVQDKLEFAGIIGMVGLRFDIVNPGDVYYPEDYSNPYFEIDENTGIPIINDPVKAETQYQLSPRIGISHPITERNLLHFTYGHYFQRPDGYFLYRNYHMQSLTKVGNYVGNPGLLPEKTVAYEIGIEHLFTDDLKGTMSGFYKDVNNLMNWEKYVARSIGDRELNVYTNADYGNIKGMEFTLNMRPGRFWGGSANYTFSVAKGRSSSYSGGSGSFTSARRMNILSYDQTHTVNATLTLRTPGDFGTNWGGFQPFADWTGTFQFRYGSGLPYSSYGTGLTNDQRKPWTSATDLKLIRIVRLQRVSFEIFLDIYNMFDRQNVIFIGNTRLYDRGDPDDPTVQDDPTVIRRDGINDAFTRNPQALSSGRQWRFGVGFRF